MLKKIEVTERSKVGRLLRKAIRLGKAPAGTVDLNTFRGALEDVGTALAREARRNGWKNA